MKKDCKEALMRMIEKEGKEKNDGEDNGEEKRKKGKVRGNTMGTM